MQSLSLADDKALIALTFPVRTAVVNKDAASIYPEIFVSYLSPIILVQFQPVVAQSNVKTVGNSCFGGGHRNFSE
jgi:hypothetical protein